MVLKNEEFWTFVDKLNDGGGLECKFCGQIFAVSTPITRFKWHWSGVEGRGVQVCSQVPSNIQEAAFLAMQQPPSKKLKTMMPSSSYMINANSTSSRGQINQVGNLVGGLERMQLEQAAQGEERASPHAHDHLGEMTEGMTQDIRRDASQATDQVGQVDIENTNWAAIASIALSMEVDVDNGMGGFVPPVAGASSFTPPPCNINHQTGVDALPTGSTKLVGKAFEKNKNAMWSWLMNDKVSLIGIYGMGGVGKTTLVKHIYDQHPSTFCPHVYWITVTQDFSICRLQNRIAKHIGLDLSNEDKMFDRAAKLFRGLMKKKKWILILDDLWNSFDLEVVGIPIQMKGCKLILITRSLRVCRQMNCQEMINVKPLSDAEAWTLFAEKFGHDQTLPPEVEQIAKSITNECGGLPLGITTVAETMRNEMRGVIDECKWRNTLRELEQSEVREDDMEPKVFRILRFSYNHLNDPAVQQCFLYCALFPEDYEIDRVQLISYLIDEGIIKMMKSRQAEFDKGHTMLGKLEDVSMLERCGHAIKMHDLFRDVALQIQQKTSPVMVEVNENLTTLPELEEWNVNLARISLMNTKVCKIPQGYAPNCPDLSTLLLCWNEELRFVANSFFRQLCNLKVLDLSGTNIEILPESVSDLVTLIALLLRGCRKLRGIPSLKRLKALRRLDLEGTELENFPNDIEWLSNLRYLRLCGYRQKEFPIGILPKLTSLQVFIQDADYDSLVWARGKEVGWVKGKEVACLRKLETLHCYFKHLSDLEEYLKSRDQTQSLSSYGLYVGQWAPYEPEILEDYVCVNKTVGLHELRTSRDGDFQVLFPNDMKELQIHECGDATSLCDISSSIENATELEVIEIRNCNGMESLLSSSWFCSALLESPSSHGLFSCLRNLICFRCVNMKKLFPLILLPHLVNLERIEVFGCDSLEEIIAASDEDEVRDMGEEECSSGSYSIAEFSLPKFRYLELGDLPQLKSICTAKLKCDSLQEITVYGCWKLKRLPFSLPLLDNGELSPPPLLKEIRMDEDTWESVECDHPDAKDALLPFVRLY